MTPKEEQWFKEINAHRQVSNKITAKLAEEGIYPYEFRCTNNGFTCNISYNTISLQKLLKVSKMFDTDNIDISTFSDCDGIYLVMVVICNLEKFES